MKRGSRQLHLMLGIGIAIGAVLGLVVSGALGPRLAPGRESASTEQAGSSNAPRPRSDPNEVVLDAEQARQLKIAPAQMREFRDERSAVGRIAFNDDRTTSIFAPFQGRVVRLMAKPGDVLRPGSPLLVVDSPDLVQANSDLIAATVAVRKAQNQLALAERVAKRQRLLFEAGAAAFKDLEQSESDFRNAEHDVKTAEGLLEGARNRLRAPFGKTDAELAKIQETGQVDRVAEILAPIGGTVTARKVSPGQFVRADNTDPMFAVADVSSMWLIVNVAEIDVPLIKVGQEVAVQVMAYPERQFRARITYVGASVDPAVRRLTVRAEIPNSDGTLKPDMFASFRIITGAPALSAAVPDDAVVREGDGTMCAWVTADRKRLVKRTIKIGLRQDGFTQILAGLQAGELVATESALFLGSVLTSAE